MYINVHNFWVEVNKKEIINKNNKNAECLN